MPQRGQRRAAEELAAAFVTTPNRLRGEARNGRRATYVGRSRRPDGDLRDKPGCVPASGCTKGAPWRISRCIGPDGSPVGGAQQRRLSPYLVSQEEKPSKSARGAGPPGTRKARREHLRRHHHRRRLRSCALLSWSIANARWGHRRRGHGLSSARLAPCCITPTAHRTDRP